MRRITFTKNKTSRRLCFLMDACVVVEDVDF